MDIELIKQVCDDGSIVWTAHILERMQERNTEPSDVIQCIKYGKIIEQYPQAYPYPACLILGRKINQTIIHVVVGFGDDCLWIITVYEPNEDEWHNGFAERKD